MPAPVHPRFSSPVPQQVIEVELLYRQQIVGRFFIYQERQGFHSTDPQWCSSQQVIDACRFRGVDGLADQDVLLAREEWQRMRVCQAEWQLFRGLFQGLDGRWLVEKLRRISRLFAQIQPDLASCLGAFILHGGSDMLCLAWDAERDSTSLWLREGEPKLTDAVDILIEYPLPHDGQVPLDALCGRLACELADRLMPQPKVTPRSRLLTLAGVAAASNAPDAWI